MAPEHTGTEIDGTKSRTVSEILALILVLYAFVGGAASLMGWILPVPRLIDWDGSGITIKANAAICIISASLALLLCFLETRQITLIRFLGLVTFVVAGLTLLEHVVDRNLGIDTMFFHEEAGARATSAPGRMGFPASVALTLLGAAVFLLTRGSKGRKIASILGTVTLFVSSFSLVGYFFGADQFYSVPRLTGIAFQTATMIAALGLAISASVPEFGLAAALNRTDSGGAIFRRFISPIVLITLALGWLHLEGERFGLYDTQFGTAAQTILEIWILLALLWWTSRGISRAEEETRLISRMPAENPYPVMRLSKSGEVVYANSSSGILLNGQSSGSRAVPVEPIQHWAREVFERNEKSIRELEVGESIYSCTFVPLREGYVNLYASDVTDTRRSERLQKLRAQELAVLYRLADRLNHSHDIQEVFDASFDAITGALNCDRASILLFDDHGVMNFEAVRGLSPEYQQAVNGHSPWTVDETNARPFGIGDIRDSDQPEELKAVIMNEGIAALAFVPLISNERLIGKFMVYYDHPHVFTETDFEIAMTVGHQVAFGVTRSRAEEQKRLSEAALHENAERLRLTTETGKVGIWDWDIRSDHVEWSDSLYAIHGISKSDFGGTVESVVQLVHPDDKERLAVAIDAAIVSDEPYDVEFRAVRPDGKIIWLYTNAIVLRDNGVASRMIGATVDLTERKLAALESAQLATIVKSSLDAIYSHDVNGMITSWNHGAETLFGYTTAEAIGREVNLLIPPDYLEEEKEIQKKLLSGEYVEMYETVRLRKDGTLLDVLLSVSPLLDSAGAVIGASKIARDITERKHAEMAMREREIMSRLVAAQEAERHRIARDLHDHLGQQLTALRLKLESIKSKIADKPTLLDEIDETRAYASRIDLDLNFLSWELRPTELDQLGLRDALSSFVREWSANYGIAAQFHSGESGERLDPEIETNLYRIVQEALHNVLKHAKAKNVDVMLEQRNDQAILIIEDDGVGFDSDIETNGKATSFGIVGMHERAALLGGTLNIESRPGSGTSIFARVPIRSVTSSDN